nr:unnamed protein product [Digitaria exilis]
MAAAAAKPHFSPHAAFSSSSPSAAPSAADAEPDFVVFRLLLPPSFSDADTMRLYAAVNPLRRRTASLQVRVEPLDPSAAGGRVVAAVLGPAGPLRRAEASSSSAEPFALSPAQEALVAVLDAEGALYRAEEGPRGGGAPGRATCLLLAEAERFEAATGRGVLGRIAREAGAVVRVVPWEEAAPLPQGHPPEEVVEITGDRTAVRKALVALSSCLQGDQPVDGSATSFNKDSSMLSWASSEVPERNVGVLRSEASTEFAQGSVVKADGSECNTGDARSRNLQQIAFRLLLPINLAGGLIGKKGLIIKGIEDETGACIDVSTPIAGCRERVITICALEITGELMNVRDALCLVCWKLRNHVFSSSGTDCTNGHVPSSDGAESNATSQANIHSTSKYSMDNAHRVDHGPSLSYGMDSVENTFSSLDLTSSEIQKLDHGNGVMINNSDDGIQKPTDRNDVVTKNLNHGILFPEENNLLREVPYAAITRITYETAVSGTILNLVCGDNGNNLAQLTEMSGADIAVYNPPSEGNEAMIVVSGPPEQAQSAQRGLVELILQGQ